MSKKKLKCIMMAIILKWTCSNFRFLLQTICHWNTVHPNQLLAFILIKGYSIKMDLNSLNQMFLERQLRNFDYIILYLGYEVIS